MKVQCTTKHGYNFQLLALQVSRQRYYLFWLGCTSSNLTKNCILAFYNKYLHTGAISAKQAYLP